MKREKIMKRAESLFTDVFYRAVYGQGAEWRINSVWHRTDEKPEDRRAVLATTDDGIPLIGGPDNSKWEEIARELGIKAWAYVDDLLPDTFDKILKDNKDVLERIKEKGD